MFQIDDEDLQSQNLTEMHLHISEILANDSPGISELAKAALSIRGKFIRPRILFAFANDAGHTANGAAFFAACVELLHVASLLQDDWLDNATIRRGLPAAHAFLGRKKAILAADYLSIRTFKALEQKECPQILHDFVRFTNLLIEGELEQELDGASPLLEESDYFRFIEKKTASLFMLAARVGAQLSGSINPSIGESFGRHFGLAYQIMDDVLDIVGDGIDKPIFSDIKNGVTTLPILHFTASGGDTPHLVHCVSNGLFNEAIALLNQRNSVEYAIHCALGHSKAASDLLRERTAPHTVQLLEPLMNHLMSKTTEGVIYGI